MDMVITRSYYGGPWRCHCSPGLGPVLCDWCQVQEQAQRAEREQATQRTATPTAPTRSAPHGYVSTRRDRRGEAW